MADRNITPEQIMQTLTDQMERMFRQLEERMNNRQRGDDEASDASFDGRRHDRREESPRRREHDAQRGTRRNREPYNNPFQGVKVNIPSFAGKSDPEAYLSWELKLENVFTCGEFDEEQKVRLAAAEFSHYALIWWHKLQRERQRGGEPPITTWAELKRIMRRRYVPTSYERDLKFKLQRMTQGSRSVEEYHKELEMLMIQANLEEDPEVTMARFLNGLNSDIRDVVELQEFIELDDLVHKANQVEGQLKRKGATRRFGSSSTSGWKDGSRKEGSGAPITSAKQGGGTAMGSKGPKEGEKVPMEACHLLLGRPWQYDHKTLHAGHTNRISFNHQGKKVVLNPLSPQEVYNDKERMREKILREKKREAEKESERKGSMSKEKKRDIERKTKEESEGENNKRKVSVERKRKESLLLRKSEVRDVLLVRQHLNHSFSGSQARKTNIFKESKMSSSACSHVQEKRRVLPQRELTRKLPWRKSRLKNKKSDDDRADLRTNPSQVGGNDEDIRSLQGLGGPMTRARAKKAKDTLQQMALALLDSTAQELTGPSRMVLYTCLED